MLVVGNGCGRPCMHLLMCLCVMGYRLVASCQYNNITEKMKSNIPIPVSEVNTVNVNTVPGIRLFILLFV